MPDGNNSFIYYFIGTIENVEFKETYEGDFFNSKRVSKICAKFEQNLSVEMETSQEEWYKIIIIKIMIN